MAQEGCIPVGRRVMRRKSSKERKDTRGSGLGGQTGGQGGSRRKPAAREPGGESNRQLASPDAKTGPGGREGAMGR